MINGPIIIHFWINFVLFLILYGQISFLYLIIIIIIKLILYIVESRLNIRPLAEQRLQSYLFVLFILIT
jgi:hypothetical protein